MRRHTLSLCLGLCLALAGSLGASGAEASLSKEQIEKLPLDKYLGERGWSDPSEWNYVD